MLFTPPSSSLPTPPIPSSVKNDSSSSLTPPTPQTPSVFTAGYNQIRSRAVSSSTNPTLNINGPPPSARLLSASQSRFSQLPDPEWFYSAPSSSSSSRPSIHHLTPTSAKPDESKSSSSSRRRLSCPVSRHNTRKERRFRFPTLISSSIRDALMTSSSTTHPSLSPTDETSHLSKTTITGCTRPSSIFLPVANPVAAAALVEDDEVTAMEGQETKSITPSTLDTPKSSTQQQRSPTDCSTSLGPTQSTNSKATLNVGGVRHEGLYLFSCPSLDTTRSCVSFL